MIRRGSPRFGRGRPCGRRSRLAEFKSYSPEDTRRIAARLARRTRLGDTICLIGPLGSGKTTFVQGFAKAWGYRGDVMSPSFGLVREYHSKRGTLYHMDLFRVRPRELANLGLEEYLQDARAVSLIEWPQTVRNQLPGSRLEIKFRHFSREARQLTFHKSN